MADTFAAKLSLLRYDLLHGQRWLLFELCSHLISFNCYISRQEFSMLCYTPPPVPRILPSQLGDHVQGLNINRNCNLHKWRIHGTHMAQIDSEVLRYVHE